MNSWNIVKPMLSTNKTKKPRTLVVDDSDEFRALLVVHLGELGCEVVKEVDNGGAVEENMRVLQPDLIFLDINLPGSNGLQLAESLRKQYSHTYVVMISGDLNAANVKRAKEIGAHDFVAKPYTIDKLDDSIKRYQTWKGQEKMPKIVLVDDEELARDFLKGILAEMSLPVAYEASNGTDALQAVETYQPDIVFLDIEMPDKNGIDVLQEIKAVLPGCFVVMVSGHSTFDNLEKAMDLGAAGFVVKPFTNKKIEQIVQKYKKQLLKG